MSADTPASNELLDALRAAVGTQYSVERVLGQGGMGSVFLGRDLTLDRPVAIKVINADVASNVTLRERFLQEARTVAKLRHPNIVSVYSAGDANGILHFAMEFVSGESLRDMLAREKRIPSERAEKIIREIALALDHAHSLGLVHRDVKPENILIDRESGRAMLTDFGVSRAFEKDGGLTQTGMILGSPRYMSPEQASGDKTIDGRSDLYSLALVAYEMYSGEPVVQSSTMAGMLVKHLTETPPPLAKKAPGIPEHVATAIDHGLKKDPNERWSTGHHFAEAVAGHALDVSGSQRAPARRPANRSKRALMLAGIGAVVAAGAAIFVSSGSDTGNAYLVAPFEIQSGDQSIAWLREGSVNMLTLTLGQWSDLHVVDYERTLGLLDKAGVGDKQRLSLDDAMKVARLADAGTVLTGQVQAINNWMVVTAKLYNVGSEKSEQQAIDSIPMGEDPRPLFDRLAQRLLSLEGGGRTSTLQLAQATTTNLEAYRAYLNGVKLLNSWRLFEADTAFDRAIALDSTFALAYHKKSLGLGWGDGSQRADPGQKAFDLSGRLPPREKSLVEGHYHLIRALTATGAGDTTAASAAFEASIRAYDDLFARGDTLVPEAWHGRADSYHHRRTNATPYPLLKDWTTESFRGFSKTLAIDSTFHLAYAHLVELFNASAAQGGRILISGDSAVVLDSATIRRLGADGIQRLRDESVRRGIAIAKAWARADDASSRPFLQLASSYMAAKQPDSAMATLRESLNRPRSGAAAAQLALITIQMSVGDTGVATSVRTTLDKYTPDTLRQVPVNQRFGQLGEVMAGAAVSGSTTNLERAARLFVATDSFIPTTRTSTRYVVDLFSQILKIAMGEPVTPETRRSLLAAFRGIDTVSGLVGQQIRNQSVSAPYLAFLATRDTAFVPFIKKWSPGNPANWSDIDGMVALLKGDTAAALRIAETYTKPDSLAKSVFGLAGMRTMARAEVLDALGLTRQAAESYEAMSADRLNRTGLAEPGYTVWVRSFLGRARMWRELGERDKAMKAYEEFIRRWDKADGVAAKQVNEAKQELNQLRDARR